MIKAFIFDLDGVITETSLQHFKAWSCLAKMLGIEIDETFNERLKGISRKDSLKEILKYGGKLKFYNDEELEKLMFCKNEYYKTLISKFTRENVFEGVIELFELLKKRGIKIAIASASLNAPALIHSMELKEYIDYIVNPADVKAGKPAPDIFLQAAKALDTAPSECIAVEDALSGVQAIKAAGMLAIGIGNKDVLKDADIVYEKTGDIQLEDLLCFH